MSAGAAEPRAAELQLDLDGGGRYLLRMADEELLVGHVLTSVAGWGPELEINIALSSMGQDEIGHARRIYQHVGAAPATVERLVYERPREHFEVAAVTRSYPRAWEALLARQVVYELADDVRLELLSRSTSERVRELVDEMRHEERYHLDFWLTWLRSTAALGPDSAVLVQQALGEVWPAACELLIVGDHPDTETSLGLPVGAFADATERYVDRVRTEVERAGLRLPARGASPHDGPQDALDEMLAEMRSVYDLAPGSW